VVQAALAVILDIKGRSNMGRYQLLDLRLKVHGRLLLKFTMYSTLWDRIPVGGEIFRTCPDRPWGPPSLLYNGYRVFPGGKERPGREADPSPPSSAVGHERVELYVYSPLWAVRPVQSLSALYKGALTIRCEDVNWIEVAQDIVLWWAVLLAVVGN